SQTWSRTFIDRDPGVNLTGVPSKIPLLHKEEASSGAIPPQGCRELCCRRVVVERVYGSKHGLGKFPQEAVMNDAIHQLIQVILQGVTWVLRTIERVWVWSWGQIESAFNISWGSLPAWKVVVGVIALAAVVVILFRLLKQSLHAFRNIAEAFWTMVMGAFGLLAFVVI